MKFPSVSWLFGILGLSGGLAASGVVAGELPVWQLRTTAQVDATGIYFDQLVAPPRIAPPAYLPHIRLALAPSAGQTVPFQHTRTFIE